MRVVAWRNVGLVFLFSLIATGCSREPSLTISAASSLTFALEELGKIFESETGIAVAFNFDATGRLAQQIEHGAPVDLFMAASPRYLDQLEQENLLLPGSRRVYATGRLCFWTRPKFTPRIETMEQLLLPQVQRIAIANPQHAPYGVAAREAFRKAGIWESIQPQLIIAADARQALEYARTGDVDVAVIPIALAITSAGKWAPVPDDLYSPLKQELAIPRQAQRRSQAEAFVRFLLSDAGREILSRYGFGIPSETE